MSQSTAAAPLLVRAAAACAAPGTNRAAPSAWRGPSARRPPRRSALTAATAATARSPLCSRRPPTVLRLARRPRRRAGACEPCWRVNPRRAAQSAWPQPTADGGRSSPDRGARSERAGGVGHSHGPSCNDSLLAADSSGAGIKLSSGGPHVARRSGLYSAHGGRSHMPSCGEAGAGRSHRPSCNDSLLAADSNGVAAEDGRVGSSGLGRSHKPSCHDARLPPGCRQQRRHRARARRQQRRWTQPQAQLQRLPPGCRQQRRRRGRARRQQRPWPQLQAQLPRLPPGCRQQRCRRARARRQQRRWTQSQAQLSQLPPGCRQQRRRRARARRQQQPQRQAQLRNSLQAAQASSGSANRSHRSSCAGRSHRPSCDDSLLAAQASDGIAELGRGGSSSVAKHGGCSCPDHGGHGEHAGEVGVACSDKPSGNDFLLAAKASSRAGRSHLSSWGGTRGSHMLSSRR